jgi:hypothetical protein
LLNARLRTQTVDDHRYTVTDKTGLERVLDMPPDIVALQTNVFHRGARVGVRFAS